MKRLYVEPMEFTKQLTSEWRATYDGEVVLFDNTITGRRIEVNARPGDMLGFVETTGKWFKMGTPKDNRLIPFFIAGFTKKHRVKINSERQDNFIGFHEMLRRRYEGNSKCFDMDGNFILDKYVKYYTIKDKYNRIKIQTQQGRLLNGTYIRAWFIHDEVTDREIRQWVKEYNRFNTSQYRPSYNIERY